MKIKLTIQDIPDKSYITLDPAPKEGPAYGGNLVNIDICDKAECTDFVAETFLDYIPSHAIEAAIKNWCGLLRHGGRIVVGGTNANEVSRLWLLKQIDTPQFGQLVFGNPIRKAGLYSVEYIEKLLSDSGIKITRKATQNAQFIIEGVRP